MIINFSITTPNARRPKWQIMWWAERYMYNESTAQQHKHRTCLAHRQNKMNCIIFVVLVVVVVDVGFLRVYILFVCDFIPHKLKFKHTERLKHARMCRSFVLHYEWWHTRNRQQQNIYEAVRPVKEIQPYECFSSLFFYENLYESNL